MVFFDPFWPKDRLLELGHNHPDDYLCSHININCTCIWRGLKFAIALAPIPQMSLKGPARCYLTNTEHSWTQCCHLVVVWHLVAQIASNLPKLNNPWEQYNQKRQTFTKAKFARSLSPGFLFFFPKLLKKIWDHVSWAVLRCSLGKLIKLSK